jgi:hypothetical protein
LDEPVGRQAKAATSTTAIKGADETVNDAERLCGRGVLRLGRYDLRKPQALCNIDFIVKSCG